MHAVINMLEQARAYTGAVRQELQTTADVGR
jgi:hypothetical protein